MVYKIFRTRFHKNGKSKYVMPYTRPLVYDILVFYRRISGFSNLFVRYTIIYARFQLILLFFQYTEMQFLRQYNFCFSPNIKKSSGRCLKYLPESRLMSMSNDHCDQFPGIRVPKNGFFNGEKQVFAFRSFSREGGSKFSGFFFK